MTNYVSLVNLRLGSFIIWRLEHVPRDSNEKADVLAAMVSSMPIKEKMCRPSILSLDTFILWVSHSPIVLI